MERGIFTRLVMGHRSAAKTPSGKRFVKLDMSLQFQSERGHEELVLLGIICDPNGQTEGIGLHEHQDDTT